MKESLNNTLHEILHSDIVTKTKSTLHDFVSGVKNLFRHTPADEENNNKGDVNSYLKSPDEIEAEFKHLSASETNEPGENSPASANSSTSILKITETKTEIQQFEVNLPEYMEENY